MSSYLFILCGAVFSALIHFFLVSSALIHKSIASSTTHGIKIVRTARVISHLLFADDNILIARAKSQEVECVKRRASLLSMRRHLDK